MTDLGTLGGATSQGHGINTTGRVVGYATLAGSERRAFLHDGSSMINLGVLSGGNSSTAYGINDAGQVVGSSEMVLDGATVTRAFLYSGGTLADLGTLGGANSAAFNINNRGQIVGHADTGSGVQHAFLYEGGSMKDLGVLPGYTSSRAIAITDYGKVIGACQSGSATTPFIFRAGRMENLNDLINRAGGILLTDVFGIEDGANIVGVGTRPLSPSPFQLIRRYFPSLTPTGVVEPGSQITVRWAAPSGSPTTDWVGLYRVGDPDTAYVWWTYTGGSTQGAATLLAPSMPGEYELRYFYNNSYRLMEVYEGTITVQPDIATPNLTVSATDVGTAAPLSVSWTVNSGRPATDWIGLFKVGDPNTAYGWWRYTNGAVSGTFDLTAPAEPGNYEFRYLLRNGYTDAARSPNVTVSASSQTHTLGVSPATIYPGGSVTVTWTAPAGSSSTDWIGLYREGETENRNYLWPHWFYTGGAESGSHSFTMPSTPGRYILRYLLNNGYVHKAQSAVITVQ